MPVASTGVPQAAPIQGQAQQFPDFNTWVQQNPGAAFSGTGPMGAQTAYAQARQAAQQQQALAQQQNSMRQDYNLPGFDQRNGQYNDIIAQALANQGQVRQQQGQLGDYLTGVMQGKDSLSQQALRQGADRNLAAQQALAASARPGQQGLAAMTAANNAGRIGMDLTGQGAMAGIAERQAAAQALGGVLGGTRGQDLGMMGQNQQLQLQNAGMQQQGQMGYQANELQRYLQQANQPSWFDKLLGAGSSVLGFMGSRGNGGGGGGYNGGGSSAPPSFGASFGAGAYG